MEADRVGRSFNLPYENQSLSLALVLIGEKLSIRTSVSFIKSWITFGSNRVYVWLPKTAAATSNPLPTFPCAWQWTYWARLWAKRLSGLSSSSKDILGMTERWTRRADVREVMSAAEDPRPVLCTSEMSTLVGVNGGICSRDLSIRGSPRDSSYLQTASVRIDDVE